MSALLSSASGGFAGVWARVSTYETKDWLGISGFFIAVWNLLYARRKDRREPLRAEICKSVDELRGSIVQLSEDVEKHLCYEDGRKSKQDIYRADRRAKEIQAGLESKLPICKRRLFELYTDFWRAISDDGFPVERREDKLARSSNRVQRVADARTALITYLDSIRAGCFTGRLKYWKTRGDFAGDEGQHQPTPRWPKRT